MENLRRLLRSRSNATSSSQSPSSPVESLKKEPREDSGLKRFLRSWTKPMIQHSTTSNGVVGSSSNETSSSPAETLKTEPTPFVNTKKEYFLNIIGGCITVGEQVTADLPDSVGLSELERQFSRENLQLVPTRFPAGGRTKGTICREFDSTGICSRAPRCPFSHQLPRLQPGAAPPLAVVRPLLFVPTQHFLPPPPPYNAPSPDFLELPPPYNAPSPGFHVPPPWYNEPSPGFHGPPPSCYAQPPGFYGPPQRYYAPSPGFHAPPSRYNAPPLRYNAPPQRYNAPPPDSQPLPPRSVRRPKFSPQKGSNPPHRERGNSSRTNPISSPQLALGTGSTPNPYGPIGPPQRSRDTNPSASVSPEPEPDTGTASTAGSIGIASTTGSSDH